MKKLLFALLATCSLANALSWKLINKSDVTAKYVLYAPAEAGAEARTVSATVNAGKSSNLELKSTNGIEEWETVKIFKAPYAEDDLIQMTHLPQPIRYPNSAEVTLKGKQDKYEMTVEKIEPKPAWYEKCYEKLDKMFH